MSIAEREVITPNATVIEQPRLRLFSRDEYHRLAETGVLGPDEKLELLEGEIFVKVSPQKTPHFYSIQAAQEILETVFGKTHSVRYQAPLVIDDGSEPEPDVMVVREPWRAYAERHPNAADVLLLIEVSDTTLRADRTKKAALYAAAGIQEYWIINLPERKLEVYREPSGNEYASRTTLGEGEEIAPLEAIGSSIVVNNLLPPQSSAKPITVEPQSEIG